MTEIPTDDDGLEPDLDDADLEALRDTFVEAYNARDLEVILELVSDDVETPDLSGDGKDALAEELQAAWLLTPPAILTRAILDGVPAAVAWLPDERAVWTRVGLLTFDSDQGRLTVIAMPDDDDALQRALAEDPIGDPLDEEYDWAEWDSGEESNATSDL